MAKKKETERKVLVCCEECRLARLMQHGDSDPVLAACTARKVLMPRQDGRCEYEEEVQVAKTMHHCAIFEQRVGVKKIEKKGRRSA